MTDRVGRQSDLAREDRILSAFSAGLGETRRPLRELFVPTLDEGPLAGWASGRYTRRLTRPNARARTLFGRGAIASPHSDLRRSPGAPLRHNRDDAAAFARPIRRRLPLRPRP